MRIHCHRESRGLHQDHISVDDYAHVHAREQKNQAKTKVTNECVKETCLKLYIV